MIQSPSTLISTVASCLNYAQQMYDHIIIIIMYNLGRIQSVFQRRMTQSIHVHLWACAVVAMMCVINIGAVYGRTIQLNWTSDGVRASSITR